MALSLTVGLPGQVWGVTGDGFPTGWPVGHPSPLACLSSQRWMPRGFLGMELVGRVTQTAVPWTVGKTFSPGPSRDESHRRSLRREEALPWGSVLWGGHCKHCKLSVLLDFRFSQDSHWMVFPQKELSRSLMTGCAQSWDRGNWNGGGLDAKQVKGRERSPC